MLRYHMAVISRDKALRRAIKRLTTATGATADFGGDESTVSAERAVDLLIFDARTEDPDARLLKKLPQGARIMYIVDEGSLIAKLSLLEDQRVTSLFCHDERFDDDEFISSATKALRGEVFGLQKYFPWGVTTFQMVLKNAQEKSRAVEVLDNYAKIAGCRGGVRDRIQLVCDELIMNALYHAPVDEQGAEKYRGKTPKELAQLDVVNQVEVRYGCSGRYFIVSVRDGQGSLSRARALEYLLRAQKGDAVIENKTTGAGLGLLSVLKSVSKLVFNLDRGVSTEVVAIFDMELFARGKSGARSLHVFTATPRPQEQSASAADVTTEELPAVRRPSRVPYVLAAALLAIVTAMGTAVYMQRTAPAPVQVAEEVSIHPRPEDATIVVEGRSVQPGETLPVAGDRAVDVELTWPGQPSRTITLPPGSRGQVVVFR